MFYSAKEKGFYSPQIHTEVPDDAIEITVEQWQSLLDGQAQGKQIVPNEAGYPVLVEVPVTELTPEEHAAQPVVVTQGQLDALTARIETFEKKRSK